MDKKFVRVLADINCNWEGLDPIYRVYVNDELFTERTWHWNDDWVEENIQINASPGDYSLKFELVPPHLAYLNVSNIRVEYGPASIVNGQLRIYDES